MVGGEGLTELYSLETSATCHDQLRDMVVVPVSVRLLNALLVTLSNMRKFLRCPCRGICSSLDSEYRHSRMLIPLPSIPLALIGDIFAKSGWRWGWCRHSKLLSSVEYPRETLTAGCCWENE